jgi:hypothetical protein
MLYVMKTLVVKRGRTQHILDLAMLMLEFVALQLLAPVWHWLSDRVNQDGVIISPNKLVVVGHSMFAYCRNLGLYSRLASITHREVSELTPI